jgi:hypothetical protein
VITIKVTPNATGTITNTAAISGTGYTETDSNNNSASATTLVNAAPPQQQPQQVVPPQTTPPQTTDPDKTIDLSLDVPKTITLDQFFDGIIVEADCKDEACLRKFREHAAINTGATHIAGFNLTVSRTSLGFKSTKNRVRLQPCKSGSQNGRRHKRCLKNLRNAAEKAKPFRVKIVVSAVDKAGNRGAKKAFVTVK